MSHSATFGIISDTHGMYRPEISSCFAGVEHIFHAGDIGKPSILRELEKIAPVTAVLGNVDLPSWFPSLSTTEIVTLHGRTFMVLHNLDTLDLDPKAAGIDVIIYGHTHKRAERVRKGVLYINPGSAGPARFLLHPGISLLTIGEELTVKHIAF